MRPPPAGCNGPSTTTRSRPGAASTTTASRDSRAPCAARSVCSPRRSPRSPSAWPGPAPDPAAWWFLRRTLIGTPPPRRFLTHLAIWALWPTTRTAQRPSGASTSLTTSTTPADFRSPYPAPFTAEQTSSISGMGARVPARGAAWARVPARCKHERTFPADSVGRCGCTGDATSGASSSHHVTP
jgi:hypothetical protein